VQKPRTNGFGAGLTALSTGNNAGKGKIKMLLDDTPAKSNPKDESEEELAALLDSASSLMKNIPSDAGKAIDEKLSSLMDGSESNISEEDFNAMMETVPEDVRESLAMVGIGVKKPGGPMTEGQLLARLPDDLKEMVQEMDTDKKEALLNVNVAIRGKLAKMDKAGLKYDMDAVVGQLVKEMYNDIFGTDAMAGVSMEEVKKNMVADYAATLSTVRTLNDRMKEEAEAYKEALQEYEDLKRELEEDARADPLFQFRNFGQKSFPQKAALVSAIMVANDAVAQLLRFAQGKPNGSPLAAATEALLIGALLYAYGAFGELDWGGLVNGPDKRRD